MGLAPTTSTTMQMALGDALAVALLTRRGFAAADFRQFHPGGRLGARLRAGARPDARRRRGAAGAAGHRRWTRALLLMTEKRFGCLGVVDAHGRLVGIVTDGDLRRAMGPTCCRRRVGEIMTPAPRTIGPDALAAEALHADERAGRGRSPRCSWSTPRGGRSASCTSTTCCARGSHERPPLPPLPAAAGPASNLVAARRGAHRASPPTTRGLARRRLVIRLSPSGCCRRWRWLLLAAIALWPEFDAQREQRPRRLSPRCRQPRSGAA